MSRISYRVDSIEFSDATLRNINKNMIIRLNLTQKPSQIAEEYLLRNVQSLHNINHEFIIDDTSNKVEKLTLTVRSVLKKTTLLNIFGFQEVNAGKIHKNNDHSVDKFVGGCGNFRNNNEVNCEYVEPRRSLIGFCTIEMKEIEKGVNNTIRVPLLKKNCQQEIGFINLEIYCWPLSPFSTPQKTEQSCFESILFVDSGCSGVAQPSPYE